MNCPICDYKGLADDAMKCPSCHADLSVYVALDATETSMQKQKKRTLLFIILFVLAIVACVAVYFIFSAGPSKDLSDELAACTTEMQVLKADNQQLKTTNETLQSENATLKKAMEEQAKPKQITHVVKEGESLYIIAKNYLGNGDLYPKIAAENGIKDPDIIITGLELIINK